MGKPMSTTPVTVACEITVEFVDFSIICRTWQLPPLPRVHLWINDGRPFRLTTKHRYDVLIVDPTDPPIFTQYSQDFFPVCHDRLDRGRLMVQWVPLFEYGPQHIRIIVRAFLNVFPKTTCGTAAHPFC